MLRSFRYLALLATVTVHNTAVAQTSWNYTYKPGFLAAGNDLYSGSFTYVQAINYCNQNDDCAGFTFDGAGPPNNNTQPTSPVQVYFKTIQNYVCCDDTWASYLKTGPPQIPDINFTIGGLSYGLRSNSHTVQVMNIQNDNIPPYNFSFVPPLKAWNRQSDRSLPGCHQLGDITLRFQPLTETNESSWAMYQTSWAGFIHNSIPLPKGPGVYSADDITPLLNATPVENRIVPSYPLSVQVTRTYESYTDPVTGDTSLLMKFNLTALTDTRIGGFGISMPADDNADQDLNRIATTNSFADPHIGSDHGFVEFIRLTGNVSLLVIPGDKNTRLEAWRPILEDCNYNGALSEWTVLSGAWSNEWTVQTQAPVFTMPDDLASTGVWPDPLSPWPAWRGNETVWVPGLENRQWNTPTMLELKAGQSATYSLRFLLASSGPRARDAILARAGEPVIEAVPGFTIGTDMNSSFLLVTPVRGATITTVQVTPTGILQTGTPSLLPSGVYQIMVQGLTRGKARISVQFTDGTEAVAHYMVLPPFATQISAFGAHMANVAWLPLDYPDPFGRGASVMPWDREDSVHHLDDSRAYIVGLSDDAGASMNLAHAMKIAWAPNQQEVQAKDDYIKYTLFGTKPNEAKGPVVSLQLPDYTVRMTMYYYCNDLPCNNSGFFPYPYPEQNKCSEPVGGPIWCMIGSMSNATYRGFNVPHQAASWYAMYRVARNYDLLNYNQDWTYYLQGAYMTSLVIGEASVGFMDGTIFREILDALIVEGQTNATIAGWAQQLNNNMANRAAAWSNLLWPFSSEFSYDTTGQEEVYIWTKRFNYTGAANRTLEAILAYMRLLPNYVWHGGARSMGDLGNNGKWFINRGTERMLMHYRAGLNNIPILEEYRSNPDDYFLLQTGMGALTGQLTNIDENGATSMGFHSVPFVLDFDPNSGDYGCGFTGITIEMSSFLVNHSTYGWLCYLCNLGTADSNGIVSYVPVDGYRVKSYIEALGVWLITEAGNLQSVSIDFTNQVATVTFASALSSPASPGNFASRPFSYLRLSVNKNAVNRPGNNFMVHDAQGNPCPVVRNAFQITPNSNDNIPTTVTLTWT